MNPQPLSTVMYVSRSRMQSQQVERLVAASRAKNTRRGITGGMIFSGRHFAQVLEGPADAVTELMSAICTDDRHDTVKPVLHQPLAARRFPMWTMGYMVLPFSEQIIVPLLTEPTGTAKARDLREMVMGVIGRDQGIGTA